MLGTVFFTNEILALLEDSAYLIIVLHNRDLEWGVEMQDNPQKFSDISHTPIQIVFKTEKYLIMYIYWVMLAFVFSQLMTKSVTCGFPEFVPGLNFSKNSIRFSHKYFVYYFTY